MIVISCPSTTANAKQLELEQQAAQERCCAQAQRLEELLDHYANPGGVAPPSARVVHTMKVNTPPDWSAWSSWKYAWFVATKATQMTGDALKHTLWGPRKKSWNIQMTLMSSLMRGAGQHTELMDVPSIRLFMGMSGIGAPNADALVTPVTFPVRRRRLRGILADFDRNEDGTRELSGEWIVGKKTWQRLQSEWKACQSGQSVPKQTERVILYIHGGAYYVGSAAEKRVISVPLAQYTDARVFALDYRLAPETTFPGPLHDAVCAYFRLVDDLHIPSSNIFISGDSAGGGLSLALMLYLRDNAYPMPAGGILMSPWVDMTMSGASWESNAAYDVIPVFDAKDHMNPISSYLGAGMEKYLTHPYASPIFADFAGLPPILIQSGDSEVLQDEITLLSRKMELAGVNVRHEEYQDGVHVFQTFPFLKIWTLAFDGIGDFVRDVLPSVPIASEPGRKEMFAELDSSRTLAVSNDGRVAEGGVQKMEAEFEEKHKQKGGDFDHCEHCGHGKTWGLQQSDELQVHLVHPEADPSRRRQNSPLKRVRTHSRDSRTPPDSPTTASFKIRASSVMPLPQDRSTSRGRSGSRSLDVPKDGRLEAFDRIY
ncbi:alpha/beta-hydrolase [Cylindrobasidium torrendii FP15055 ss-10]|uniref:Alpha/beta-hydrolase n=1 Tax=Cylindrobasidium torrendii FP15055 ss-10 TaxID=1314674 RepID=A0A0D7B8W5_9AGAR|nr:alpha/beta-hydrolase [Cylindrobasidium torrendii FP15055 ss-10]